MRTELAVGCTLSKFTKDRLMYNINQSSTATSSRDLRRTPQVSDGGVLKVAVLRDPSMRRLRGRHCWLGMFLSLACLAIFNWTDEPGDLGYFGR